MKLLLCFWLLPIAGLALSSSHQMSRALEKRGTLPHVLTSQYGWEACVSRQQMEKARLANESTCQEGV